LTPTKEELKLVRMTNPGWVFFPADLRYFV
jgi:hypothetical protein